MFTLLKKEISGFLNSLLGYIVIAVFLLTNSLFLWVFPISSNILDFGYANMEWKIPNTVDTKFEIGSVTKQFTAMLIVQLAAENKISFTDTISYYLPDMPKKFGNKITIHQLLTHTSGLPSHFSSMQNNLKIHIRIPYTFKERLDQKKNSEFEFEPGTSWSYSGFGYSVLGEIVEHENNGNREFMLHFCDEGCIIPNIEGLDHCPKGHSGFHERFFPLFAVLKSEPIANPNENNLRFLSNGLVRIAGNVKQGACLEYEIRRIENKEETNINAIGLLN